MTTPGPYLAEKIEKLPDLSVKFPEVSGILTILQSRAHIYRFNGYWTKSEDLH